MIKTALVTTYKGLFGCSPCIAGFGRSEFHVGLNKGFSFLVFAQPDQIFWTVFLKNEKETRWPTTVKYTDKDAEDVAAQLLEVPITKTVLFGQLWKSRIKAGLVSLEEGVLDHWHSGRIALIGDAVHKVKLQLTTLFHFALPNISVDDSRPRAWGRLRDGRCRRACESPTP